MINKLKSVGERAVKAARNLVKAGVDSRAVRAISGGIALWAMSHVAEMKKAEAQETPSGTLSTEFDDGVNGIENSLGGGRWAESANTIPDPVRDDEFWITWKAPDEGAIDSADIYWAKFRIADDGAGGYTMTKITPTEPYPGFSPGNQLVLKDRGDGVFDKISEGPGVLMINGEEKCAAGFRPVNPFSPSYIGLSHNAGELRVAIDPIVPSYTRNYNIYKGNLNAVDICDDIEAQIAAGDIYETGAVDPYESDFALDDICGPEDPIDGNWVAVTRADRFGDKETHLFHRDPDGTLKYQERDVDGTYADEDIDWLGGGTPNPDFGDNNAFSLLMRETAEGSKPVILVHGNSGRHLAAHIIDDLTRQQRPVEMLVDETALELENRDSDGDGVPDSEDGAWLRADPEQTDVSGPAGTTTPDGVNDVVGIQCEGEGLGGFAVHPAGETAASGRLRVCRSENGYAYAYTFDTAEQDVGSNLESNMPIDAENFNAAGDIVMKPGQTIRYLHSADPRFLEGESRQIIFGDGYDISLRFDSTAQLNGTPGESTLSYNTNEDPFGTAPRIETFFSAGAWSSGGPAYGAALALGGTIVEATQGSTRTPRDCESLPGGCVLPGGEDGGTGEDPDGGVDGTDAGTGTEADAGAPTPDEGTPPPDGGETPDMEADSGEPEPDADRPADGPPDPDAPTQQTPDGGTPDAKPMVQTDSGPIRTDLGMRQPADPKGCACDVSANNESAGNEPPGWLLMVAGTAFAFRRRIRNGIREIIAEPVSTEL